MENAEEEEEKMQILQGKDENKIGNIRKMKIRGKLWIVLCILMTEFCERLAYYSITSNLVLFCTSRLGFSDPEATKIHLIFGGTVMVLPLLGGFISDSVTGKFNTILGGGLLYILGSFLFPASAIDYKDWFGKDDDGSFYDLSQAARRSYFFVGLSFVAIGTAGIKANVGPYGAQQVQELGKEAVQSFFNWFYWIINAGGTFAYFIVAYVQQNVSFSIGFLIPFVSMIFAVLAFVVASRRYIDRQPKGGILKDVFGVCFATKCKGFDHARQSNGGKYSDSMVNGVIAVLRIIPFFLLLVLYYAVYAQVGTTFYLQGERLNIQLGNLKLPVAFLNVFNTIIVMILIPIVDRIIYPCLAKYNRRPTYLQRMGFGMILATSAVFVAGVLEIFRKKDLASTGGVVQFLDSRRFNASDLSIFLQVPQICLLGSSDVFLMIPALEFAFTQAPESLQGVIMGIYLLIGAIGSYVAQLIISIVEKATKYDPWFPREINKGHLEYLFFLFGGLLVLNWLGLLLLAKFYKYRKQEAETETNSSEHDMADNDSSNKYKKQEPEMKTESPEHYMVVRDTPNKCDKQEPEIETYNSELNMTVNESPNGNQK